MMGGIISFLNLVKSGLVILLVVCYLVGCQDALNSSRTFEYRDVDINGPSNPWAKGVGDINGDGFPDLIVGGNAPVTPVWWRRALNKMRILDYVWPDQGELVWYESPSLTKHVISEQYRFRTDVEVVDVDGDGRNDVIALTDSGIVWFKNPDWNPTLIDSRVLHDIEVADINRDGYIDIVARSQQLFGHNDGDRLEFYFQTDLGHWNHESRIAPEGEGLKIADMDGDGLVDVVVNQYWFRNLGVKISPKNWVEFRYCDDWSWPHAYLDVHDMNGDGRLDVVMAPAEPVGQYFRLSWCELSSVEMRRDVEHVVDLRVETVMHSVVAGDFDLDGRADLATALMPQGHGSKDVALYVQDIGSQVWSRQIIGSRGSHSMKSGDFDLDGDLDLLGANWAGEDQPVQLWINNTESRTASKWRRHLIDPDMPWRSVFIGAGDIDGDGLIDIAAGSSWYANPGAPSNRWARNTFGQPLNNVALLGDLNGDGTLDVFASTWDGPGEWGVVPAVLNRLGIRPLHESGGFAWASNDGQGHFTIHRNIQSGHGDFLQGVALVEDVGDRRIALSWHESGRGVQALRLPTRVDIDPWVIESLSPASQDEALSSGDVDRDGRIDLLLGTHWLRNQSDGVWTPFNLHPSSAPPDRNVLVDMNQDGRLDAVIGYEAISVSGLLAWYEQGNDATQAWQEHVIARVIGPMSLSVADMDGDGDLDVVVGEHQLRYPKTARLMWFENRDGHGMRWVPHTIHTGDEHHDGALAVDIDGDGDLDILSIGWGHNQLLLYENLRATRQ
jgi:hypothetical protein